MIRAHRKPHTIGHSQHLKVLEMTGSVGFASGQPFAACDSPTKRYS